MKTNTNYIYRTEKYASSSSTSLTSTLGGWSSSSASSVLVASAAEVAGVPKVEVPKPENPPAGLLSELPKLPNVNPPVEGLSSLFVVPKENPEVLVSEFSGFFVVPKVNPVVIAGASVLSVVVAPKENPVVGFDSVPDPKAKAEKCKQIR